MQTNSGGRLIETLTIQMTNLNSREPTKIWAIRENKVHEFT